MELNMETLMNNKWFHYLLYAIFFLILYFGLLRPKILEKFDIGVDKNNIGGSSDNGDDSNGSSIQDADSISEDLKKSTEKIKDSLHLNKYRKNMEDIIIDMNDWISIKGAIMLPSIASKMAKSNSGDNISDIINDLDTLNKMYQSSITLNSIMRYIDKQ